MLPLQMSCITLWRDNIQWTSWSSGHSVFAYIIICNANKCKHRGWKEGGGGGEEGYLQYLRNHIVLYQRYLATL